MSRSSACLILLLCTFSPSRPDWPLDTEPYGFMGCKQLRFRGVWEHSIDSAHIDESIDGTCITVALANICIAHQWPDQSNFDGIFLTWYNSGIIKRIDHVWNYALMTGPGTIDDCEYDDPSQRFDKVNPPRTGLDEIRQLVYTVERAYGYDHEQMKTNDPEACGGMGYFAVEHVLRNRLGYPMCRTIPANQEKSRQKVIRDLYHHIPVIAMRCDHIYLLDGFRIDSTTGRELLHSCDFLQGTASMGWFPWKQFYAEKVEWFVVDITPDYTLLKGPSSGTVHYNWGDGFIPGTKDTQRNGRIIIRREGAEPLDSVGITVIEERLSAWTNQERTTLFRYRGRVAGKTLIIPQSGFFPFDVEDSTRITVSLSNWDPWGKTFRILFQDFVREAS